MHMDIAKRFKAEAVRDRIKLVSGAVVMTLLVLVFVFVIVGVVESRAAIVALLAPVIVALFALAVFLVLRLVKKMEHDSFGEGMHIVMESVPMVSALLSRDLNLVYCNREAPKLYGFKNRQEYYAGFFSLMPELQPDGRDSKNELARHVRKAFHDGKTTFEWWNRAASGEMVPVKVTFVSAFFDGEDHLLEFTEDLREEYEIKRQEKALRERSQAILDSSPMLCILYDKDSNVLEVNEEAEKLFGIPDKRIFANNFRKFLPETQPDGSDSFRKNVDMLRQAFRDGEARYEWMYKHSDGSPIPTEEFFHRITIDDTDFVIAYSRDMRRHYREKEKDKLVRQRIQVMVEQLNEHVTEQAAAVSESSAAIEEMIANIQSVTGTLSKNIENVRELQEASEVGHTSLSGVAADIQEIARESESLLEINSVMQTIASQTNLLSMNAAIEAAHAGDLGMGFAVVANEIRKLAESSASQSKTISSVLKKIKVSIDKITRSTDGVLGKFDAIEDGVKIVAEQENSILNAMEEQEQGSHQILQSVSQLNDITHRVKEDAQKMVESSAAAMQQGRA